MSFENYAKDKSKDKSEAGSAPAKKAKKKDAPWKNVFGCPKCKQIYFFSGVVKPGILEICCNQPMKKISSKAEFEALLED